METGNCDKRSDEKNEENMEEVLLEKIVFVPHGKHRERGRIQGGTQKPMLGRAGLGQQWSRGTKNWTCLMWLRSY